MCVHICGDKSDDDLILTSSQEQPVSFFQSSPKTNLLQADGTPQSSVSCRIAINVSTHLVVMIILFVVTNACRVSLRGKKNDYLAAFSVFLHRQERRRSCS